MSREPSLRLGILDLGLGAAGQKGRDVLLGSFEHAVCAEGLGYSRYWLAEHHGEGAAHSCPEILAGLIAQVTSRIRVGTAGVLLTYYSPLKVAKDFRLLNALFPGRIDLGVGAGRVDDETARGLLGPPGAAPDYYEKVSELAGYLREPRVPVTPRGLGAPELWVLGSGGLRSARAAAGLGTAYSLALFLGGKD
jgi:luciferase family oxidoreductase group 1